MVLGEHRARVLRDPSEVPADIGKNDVTHAGLEGEEATCGEGEKLASQ